MFNVISAGLGILGSGIKGFFGIKGKQADLIKESINTLSEINTSNSAKEKAIATILSNEIGSKWWLPANWRPLVVVIFTGMLVAYFCGYTSENLLKPLPEKSGISYIFEIVKISIMGYMPLRTVDKLVAQLNVGTILKKFIDKKL